MPDIVSHNTQNIDVASQPCLVAVAQTIIEVIETRPLVHQIVINLKPVQSIEVAPVHITRQEIHQHEYVTHEHHTHITQLTLAWLVINIDRLNPQYYYIQYQLQGEQQYQIQRINRQTYQMQYNTNTANLWPNREELEYE